MVTPKDVAELFLRLSDIELGDILSNKKIHFLLYYAQGFSLAINNKPLFKDDIVVWVHGPVIESLYDYYKVYGINPIPYPNDFDVRKFSKKEVDFLKKIHNEYAQFSGWKLAQMVKNEHPILETKPGEIISKQLLKKHFLTKIKYHEHKNKKNYH